MDSSHPQDDFSSRFFIWHEWIQANGPLTGQNALDYFATSMFYDKQSNNQVLRMQTMHTGMPLENEAEELKRFTGLEFALVHDEAPSLFIIHKRDRLSSDEVRPLAAYFIVHNRIYQAPDVYNVVSNRLLATLSSLQASLGTLLAHKPDFTPRSGFLWPVAQAKATEDEAESLSKKHADDSIDENPTGKRNKTVFKKQENATLLFNAMRTTAAQTQVPMASQASFNAPESAEDPAAPPTAARISATPGAPSRAPSRPPPSNVGQEVTAKPPPGGGKKKRKRTLIAPA